MLSETLYIMKRAILIFSSTVMLASCSSFYQVETAKQLANNKISSKDNYGLLATAVGISKKEIKRSEARTIDTAIARLLKTVPGGKCIRNARIYVVKRNYLAVSGDVYGTKNDELKPLLASRKSGAL